MRAAIYIRVSRPEQAEGYSLDAQRRACQEYAEKRGWDIVEVYEEPGFSARTTQRPEFQRMIADAKAGRFDVILVHKLDRFSRNVVDILRLIKLFEASDIALVCIVDNFDYSTPFGKLVLTQMAAIAEWYLNNLREEISKGKRERARQGFWNADPPFGYCRGLCKDCKDPNGEGYCPNYGGPVVGDGKHLIHHPKDSQGVLLAFKLYAGGDHASSAIARALNEAGYRTNRKWAKRPDAKVKGGPGPFTRDTVRRMLQNNFYIGLITYKNEVFPGKHEPLVDQDLWERAQAIRRLTRCMPRTEKRSVTIYPLGGILYCAQCRGKMWGLKTKWGPYYRDSTRYEGGQCSQPMVKAEVFEDQIGELIKSLALPEEITIVAQNLFNEEQEEREERERRRGLLEARLERLKRLYLDGDILDPDYTRERDSIKRELARLTVADQAIIEAGETLDSFPLIWESATPLERKELLHVIFEAVYVRGEKIIAVRPQRDFYPLFAFFEETPLSSLEVNSYRLRTRAVGAPRMG